MEIDRDEFFREVTLRVSSSLDIVEALRNLLEYLRHFIPIDTIGLNRIDMERRSIYAVAEVARSGAAKLVQEDFQEFPIDAEFWELIQHARESNQLVTINNNAETLPASVRNCFPHLITRSVIGLHLSIKHENIGGLVLSTEGRNQYNEQHAALLGQVKEPISLAMSNAWRFRELERLRDQLAEENRALSLEMERAAGVQVVGADFGLAQVMEMARRVAPMTSPVLLLGETGTGKEVIANVIHLLSPRNQAPMVRVQCGAIPETLLDSELFGHEKGAFTGAIERKRGRFERAAGGTIFLDEIGELSSEAQVKLLRVLQDRQFERVGGTETLTADVRVIAATHRDLAQMVRAGRFREDLWYRLNVFPIYIPPLRMRRQDIPPLVHHFVERKAREMNLGRTPSVAPGDIARLQAYEWPGNVRELQNIIERAIIQNRGGPLFFPPLGAAMAAPLPGVPAAAPDQLLTLNAAAAEHIRRMLTVTGGRIAGRGGAAELLGVNPSTLRSRMKKLGIRVARACAPA